MNIILLCFTAFVALCVAEDTNFIESRLERIESKVTKIQDTLDGKDKAFLVEVANGKKVYQSSQYFHFVSANAVDGNLATITHTSFDQVHPYLMIDLGHLHDVKRVDVFNRIDCSGKRLHNVGIYTGPSHNDLTLYGFFKGPSATKDHLIFYCKPSRLSRYVKVMINGTGTLTLAEVKVYALQSTLVSSNKN